MYMTLGDRPDLSKLITLIVFGSFWVCGVHGKILRSSVSDSHFGKRPGAGDMIIFLPIFAPPPTRTSPGRFPGRYLTFVCRLISSVMHLKSCLGPPWAPTYDPTCKDMYFYRDHTGYQRRTCLIFRLSALKIIYFPVINIEDDLFLGYQRRR